MAILIALGHSPHEYISLDTNAPVPPLRVATANPDGPYTRLELLMLKRAANSPGDLGEDTASWLASSAILANLEVLSAVRWRGDKPADCS